MTVASLWERRLAYILTLGVVPLYRRNGLGAFCCLPLMDTQFANHNSIFFGGEFHGVDACVWHRNGAGRQLLDKLQEYLEEHDNSCQVLYLHCLSTNRPALRFYQVQCTLTSMQIVAWRCPMRNFYSVDLPVCRMRDSSSYASSKISTSSTKQNTTPCFWLDISTAAGDHGEWRTCSRCCGRQ
jgi:GNAT superfamily N-acetyltransferase